MVVLGKQGAGKGTQCEMLAARRGVPHVSTGDMLRTAVKQGTPLGQRVKAVMDAGRLVDDDLIMELLADRLARPDATVGALLDGCTRTVAQADRLDALIGRPVTVALNIDVPTALVMERLSARRVCSECGTIYHVGDPSVTAGACEKCGGQIIQRDDDQPAAIAQRLAAYEKDTKPLLDYYGERGLLETVNGDHPAEDVARAIDAVLARRGF